MSDWSNNNLAHRYCWYITRRLGIHTLGFQKSRDLKLQQFSYFLAAATKAEQKQRARAFASILINLLEDLGEAVREKGVTPSKALSSLTSVLSNGNNSLMDLSHTVDELYYFKGE
ncbi:MAG: hypothetical protein OEZ68_14035 [Gammaproteobacteria bacterium]|nr:hypothetical protein [Gammaproteobacteria bacterium]MDH5801922.1 hypothetical protein [Gammaproteobacteria bacterium]